MTLVCFFRAGDLSTLGRSNTCPLAKYLRTSEIAFSRPKEAFLPQHSSPATHYILSQVQDTRRPRSRTLGSKCNRSSKPRKRRWHRHRGRLSGHSLSPKRRCQPGNAKEEMEMWRDGSGFIYFPFPPELLCLGHLFWDRQVGHLRHPCTRLCPLPRRRRQTTCQV